VRGSNRKAINFIAGLLITSAIIGAVIFFLEKLEILSLLKTGASFIPAILIGVTLISSIVITLKFLTRLIAFLHKALK